MYLVNTQTLQLEEFLVQPPQYAILSHRWGDDEVTFQQLLEDSAVDGSAGLSKIKRCCELARSDFYDYVWIDTCCIDKKSSAELSESINSMFAWYRDAAICYAFMSDVPPHGSSYRMLAFRKSAWWTRGWTLQELLAPAEVIFYDQSWIEIGRKTRLTDEIMAITGVDQLTLEYPPALSEASVARRMSWAAHRTTTRPEDIAYCLLGLFDISMPLLYGEGGTKAFMRLQLEIIRKSDDESIFAWSSDVESAGMLALSPSMFAGSGNIVPLESSPKDRMPYTMTNKGLELRKTSTVHREGSGRWFQAQILGQDYESILLRCISFEGWSLADPFITLSDDELRDRLRYVRIELGKIDDKWERVNCRQLSFGRDFRDYKEGPSWIPIQKLYYVKQEGL